MSVSRYISDLAGTLQAWFRIGGGGIEGKEISSPANPASTFRRLFAKTDGWYDRSSAGAEAKLVTLEEVQDDLGGTTGGDGFLKTADGHLAITYADGTPSLTLTVIPIIAYAPTGIEIGNVGQDYDVSGTTWVDAVAGGTLGAIPDEESAGHTLSDCLTAIATSRDGAYLNVRESTGAASATNPLTVQFLFSGVTDFSAINTRSYYTGSVAHSMSIQLWNFTSSAWDTYATFAGESDYVSRSIEIFNGSLYISGGVVKLQFIHTSSGLDTHQIKFDFVQIVHGGQGSGGASIASAIAYTPTGGVAATNVQAAINELDTEKASTTHASGHIDGGSDAIDGDKLEISWDGMSNYTRTTVATITDQTDQLTSHLKGIDSALGSVVGGSAEVEQIENTLSMMGWDLITHMDAGTKYYDDWVIEDFNDTGGINTGSSTFTDATTASGYVSNVAASSGNTTDAAITTVGISSGTALVQDLRGTITYYNRTAANTGIFKTASGGSDVTVGASGTNTNVIVGTIAYMGGTGYTITEISGGDNKTVTLSAGDPSSGDCSSIQGLIISSTDLAVNKLSTTPATAGNTTDGDDITTSNTRIRHDDKMPNGAIITHVSVYTTTSGIVKFAAFLENSSTSYTGTLLQSITTSNTGEQTFELSSPWTVPASGDYYIGCYNNSATMYNICANSGGDRRTASSGDQTGSTHTSYSSDSKDMRLGYTYHYEYAPSATYAAVTDSVQKSATLWSNLTSVGITATPSTAYLYYAASFNKGDADEEWWVYLSSTWRGICRLNGGSWEYKDSGGTYQTATTQSRLFALAQAFAVSQNQMNEAAIEGIAEATWDTKFEAQTLDLAIGAKANSLVVPTFDKATYTYKVAAQNMTLLTTSWEASANDPTDAFIVLDLDPQEAVTIGTDYTAEVSINNGSNYETITLESTAFRTVGVHEYYRGDLTGITSRTDSTIVVRLKTLNSKSIRTHGYSLGLKW